tara:strand:+ start:1190 stop:2311 length:1122 start_codon:yes stop_codon:yes gene_type:complete
MRLYYFFYSFFYFIKLAFKKKHYRIIFYAPHHFNRGKNFENIYFKDLLDLCKIHNLSFLYLEEPDLYSNHKRSEIAIPFDFIYYLIVFLRKFMKSNTSFIDNDKKIGSFIKKIFFTNITFDNYITISQSMLSFFNGVNSDAKRFDLQHGTIHAVKRSYLYNGLVSSNLKENDVTLLISGNAYRDILINNDTSNYFENHIHVIGIPSVTNVPSELNKNVLVSLQFTHDHSKDENKQIADSLQLQIKNEPTFHFYLKNHPRFNDEIDLRPFLSFPNVSLFSGDLNDSFNKCSFHLTSYSTVAFEASLQAIPTCFLQLNPIKMSVFKTQYNYPFYNYLLSDLYDNYSVCSLEVQLWARQFYQPFCEETFLKSLKNA